MDLTRLHSDKTAENGPFTTNIEFADSWNEIDLGPDNAKSSFKHHARRACYDLGIIVGVTETEKGFTLGFKRREDYQALISAVEPKLLEGAAIRHKRFDGLAKSFEIDAEQHYKDQKSSSIGIDRDRDPVSEYFGRDI